MRTSRYFPGRQLLRIAALAIFAAFLSGAGAAADDPASDPATLGFDPAKLKGIDSQMQGFIDAKQLPGASILIARHGKIAYRKNFGDMVLDGAHPQRDDTIFRIYSMTKPITATAVMLLVQDDKLMLDDPVSKYIPEFAHLQVYTGGSGAQMTTEPARPMTIAQLLTHTSGLSYSFQPRSPVAPFYVKAGLIAGQWYLDPGMHGLEDVIGRLAKIPLVFQPGERWHYGMSLEVAALIVQRVSGMPFDRFLQTRIFDPLKMREIGRTVPADKIDRFAALYSTGLHLIEAPQTSPYLKPPSVQSGSGGLVSTMDDYFRFAQMLDNGGTLDGTRVLSQQSVDRMMTNYLRPDELDQLSQAAEFGYGGTGAGLGFGYGGAVIVDAGLQEGVGAVGEYGWGGAANTTFWVDRKNDVVVVFMTQLLPSGALPLRDTLRKLVYQALTHPER